MNKISAKVGNNEEMKPVDVPEATVNPAGRSVDELKARLETIKNFI